MNRRQLLCVAIAAGMLLLLVSAGVGVFLFDQVVAANGRVAVAVWIVGVFCLWVVVNLCVLAISIMDLRRV